MSKDYIVTIKLKNEEIIETTATINFINMLTAVTKLCKEKNVYCVGCADCDVYSLVEATNGEIALGKVGENG